MIKILLADDHVIFREGLAELLDGQPLFRIVGSASDGAETLSKIYSLTPDVVLLDLSMKILDGIEVTASLRKQGNPVRILMLSMHNDAISIKKALDAGVDGYVLKEEAYDALETAIIEVARGESFLSPLAKEIVDGYTAREGTKPLSPRELQILGFIADGKTTKEISSILDISAKTVDNHRQRLMEKLNCHKSTELVKFALQEGLLKG